MSRDRRSTPPADSRDARRGAALRANLARRKAQARERATSTETEAPVNEVPMTDKPQDGLTASNPASSED